MRDVPVLTLDVTRAKSIRLGWGMGAVGWRGLFFRRSDSLLTLERGAKIPGEGQRDYLNIQHRKKKQNTKKMNEQTNIHTWLISKTITLTSH